MLIGIFQICTRFQISLDIQYEAYRYMGTVHHRVTAKSRYHQTINSVHLIHVDQIDVALPIWVGQRMII